MDREQHNQIADLIKALLPTATVEEQREAEQNLNQFLDAIDVVHARLKQEGWCLRMRDKSPRDARVNLSANN